MDNELSEAFDDRPFGHTHSFGLVQVFLRMVASAIGYRAAARALSIVSSLLPGGAAPSANGGQFWVLRLGLYELKRPKEQADDWVWLIDHTIQTGNGRCFVVVGVRVAEWNALRSAALAKDPNGSFALRHQDLSVWTIERVDSSNGEVVCRQLEKLSETTGIVPRAILSDQGADVRNGAEMFSESRGTVVIHDIAHAVANAVKRQLNGCDAWTQFLSDVNQSKARIRQTPLAFLLPPDLKTKARWMNLDPLLAWSRRVMSFLDDPQAALARAEITVSDDVVEEKMSWLRGYAASLEKWSTMLEAAGQILKSICNTGYHANAARDLCAALSALTDRSTRAMIDEVLTFVSDQSSRVDAEALPASTEILESLIGKGKQLQGRSKNGYTKTVLAMAATVLNDTRETIAEAFRAVSCRDVDDWIDSNMGLSLQAQRQRALSGTKPG